MEREYLQKVLEDFANSRLDTIYSEENFKDEEIIPSKRHQRKMKKIIWTERYFGTHIKLGYTVRRVAVVGAVVLTLAAANQVSAKAFGVNPWETIVRSLDGVRHIHFVKPSETGNTRGIDGEADERTQLVPSLVPEGYKQVESQAEEGKGNWSEWRKGEECILYSSDFIIEDMNVIINAEYKSKERVVIAGYVAEYLVYDDRVSLIWNDCQYLNDLYATGIDKEELIKIAESMYEKENGLSKSAMKNQ